MSRKVKALLTLREKPVARDTRFMFHLLFQFYFKCAMYYTKYVEIYQKFIKLTHSVAPESHFMHTH